METFLTPEMFALLVNNGLGGVSVVLLFNVNERLRKMASIDDDHERRLRVLEQARGAVAKASLVLCVFFMSCALSGCLQFDARNAVDSGASGAVAGFTAAGPIGGIVGAIVAAIAGGFAVKKQRQVKRRERIIDHYRSAAGDLPVATVEKLRTG